MKKNILFLCIIIIAIGLLTRMIIKHNITSLNKQIKTVPHETLNNEILQQPRNDAKFKKQWGLFNTGENGIPRIDINLLPALKLPKKDNTVLVGVLDTGIDINHINLKENIFVNKDEIPDNAIDDDGNGYIDDINGWDFINDDNTVFDSLELDKHGTQSAGIIKIVPENINIKIIPLKIMESSIDTDTKVLIKAIDYAQKMNVKIINCSWQGFKHDKELKAMMKNSDILFICAAGNSSCNVTYLPSYPACFDLPNIISVASINNNGELSAFSNYGNKIHVAAPGENVVSTIPGDSYETVKGTSIAAPFITGTAAILKNLFPNLSNLEISNRIKENVFRIDALTGKVTTGGLVDVYAALFNDNKSLKCPQFNDVVLFQDGAELFWNKVENASSYELEIDRCVIQRVNGTAYKHQNINIKDSHIFRVRAINGEKKSDWSISIKII